MLNKIKKFFEFSSKHGFYLPTAYDHPTKSPSVTLLAFYLGLLLSVASIVAYHFRPDDLMGPTSMTLMFLGMTYIFFKLRQLDKVKLNLQERSFELEDSPDAQTNTEKEKDNE